MAEKIGAIRERLRQAFAASDPERSADYSKPGLVYMILERHNLNGGIDIKLASDELRISWFLREPYKEIDSYYFRITPTQYIKLRDYINDIRGGLRC